MAYIPEQLRIDTERENQRLGFLAGAVNSFGDVMSARQKAIDLEAAKKKATTAENFAFAKDGVAPEAVDTYRKTGDSSGIMKFYQDDSKLTKEAERAVLANKNKVSAHAASELDKPVEERDSTKKGVIVAREGSKIRAQEEGIRFDRNLQAQKEEEQRRLENEKQGKLTQAAVQDFDFASPDIIPTQKDAESVKKMNAATQNFSRMTDEIKTVLGEMKKTTNPADIYKYKIKLDQKLGEARLLQKTIKDLGVLNGPDLPLVDATLGDAGSITKLLMLGPDEAGKRVDEAKAAALRNLETESGARGYKRRIPVQEAVSKYTPEQLKQRRAELEAKEAAMMAGGQP